MERLGNLERLHRAREAVAAVLGGEQPPVDEHPDGLDRVERNPLGPFTDLRANVRRQTGDEAVEELVPRRLRQRLEDDRMEAARARAPVRAPLEQLGPRERDHVDRERPGPVEQVFDEVEQAGVRPVQVLEEQHGGPLLGEPLEEEPPGREQILPVGRHALGEAEQVLEPRLDPGPLVGVRDVLGKHRFELRESRGCVLVLGDGSAHPHHLRQRPVGDAFPVGETAPAVPPDLVDQPVEVFLELPGQA